MPKKGGKAAPVDDPETIAKKKKRIKEITGLIAALRQFFSVPRSTDIASRRRECPPACGGSRGASQHVAPILTHLRDRLRQ